MNSVGIDISKGKCMVAALRSMGELSIAPHEVMHTAIDLEKLACQIIELGEDTRVIMADG